MMAWKDKTPYKQINIWLKWNFSFNFLSGCLKKKSLSPPNSSSIFVNENIINQRELWVRDVCCKYNSQIGKRKETNFCILLAILRCFDSMWNGHSCLFRSENITWYINWNLTLLCYCLLEENFTMLGICPPIVGWVVNPPKRYVKVVTLRTYDYDIRSVKTLLPDNQLGGGHTWWGWALNPMPGVLMRGSGAHRCKKALGQRQRLEWCSCKLSIARDCWPPPETGKRLP